MEDDVPTSPGEVHDDEEDEFKDKEIANKPLLYMGGEPSYRAR